MTVINEHEGMSNDGDRVEELQTAIADAAAELADRLVAIAKRRSAPMTSIAAIRDKIADAGRAVSSADAHACAQAVSSLYQSAVPDMVYLLDCVSALRDAIADAAADLTDIAESLAMRYGKLEMDRGIIRRSIAEAVDALIDAEREAVEPEQESRR
jgi:hypothetical protein